MSTELTVFVTYSVTIPKRANWSPNNINICFDTLPRPKFDKLRKEVNLLLGGPPVRVPVAFESDVDEARLSLPVVRPAEFPDKSENITSHFIRKF